MHQSVVVKLIRDARRALETAGVDFCIVTPEGEVVGTLEPVLKKQSVRNKWRETGYQEVLNGMAPGQVECIRSQAEQDQLEKLRIAILGYASDLWGPGNCTTYLDREENGVVVVRLVD